MADLKSDIIGRVNRLPLKPSERTALLPLIEAVSNSIYAITEHFKGDTVKNGRIAINIVRDSATKDLSIIGFDIEDNGVGFTEDNFKSFLIPDSRLKEGKGVGRLGRLKVFRDVEVDMLFGVVEVCSLPSKLPGNLPQKLIFFWVDGIGISGAEGGGTDMVAHR